MLTFFDMIRFIFSVILQTYLDMIMLIRCVKFDQYFPTVMGRVGLGRRRGDKATWVLSSKQGMGAHFLPRISFWPILHTKCAEVCVVSCRRRLHEAGLFGRVAAFKSLLSAANSRTRLEFAGQQLDAHADVVFWRQVVFSDEKTF